MINESGIKKIAVYFNMQLSKYLIYNINQVIELVNTESEEDFIELLIKYIKLKNNNVINISHITFTKNNLINLIMTERPVQFFYNCDIVVKAYYLNNKRIADVEAKVLKLHGVEIVEKEITIENKTEHIIMFELVF